MFSILLSVTDVRILKTRNQDLRSCSTIQDMALWDEPNIECALAIAFLASNSLHNHGGQKLSCPSYNTKNFEQIHCNKLFCGMFGLAMMPSISTLDVFS